MRSIIIAAAFSCACLPGEPGKNLILGEPAYPVSNNAGKSSRLDRTPDDDPVTEPAPVSRPYLLASADPNAIVVEKTETDALAAFRVTFEETPEPEQTAEPETTASLPSQPDDAARKIEAQIDRMIVIPRIPADPDLAPPISKEALCGTLADAAQNNKLPVVFFNNLIWQESRFKTRAVSPVGAQGVAQFMPYVAARVGLSNPFDPFQALPASARLLKTLVAQFGNFGLAAAAYNVGPTRVVSWLSKRSRLPAETRNYVQAITGRPAEHWRARTRTAAFRLPAKAPCREMPTFAQAEQEAVEQEIAQKAAEAEKARATAVVKASKVAKVAPPKDVARFQTAANPQARPTIALKPVPSVTSRIAAKLQPGAKKLRTAALKK